jgi:hypothetical protein
VGCGFFRKDGVGLTGKVEVGDGFCEFYSQVGPKLVAKIKREREGAFLDYIGDRVRESLFWRPTTPLEVGELCGSLDPHKGMGWDEVSPRVIKTVAREISGPLSPLFNCCMRGVTIWLSSRWHGWYRSLRVLEFLDRQGVVIPGQYSFRSGHSRAMAVVDMVERVRGGMEEEECRSGGLYGP